MYNSFFCVFFDDYLASEFNIMSFDDYLASELMETEVFTPDPSLPLIASKTDKENNLMNLSKASCTSEDIQQALGSVISLEQEDSVQRHPSLKSLRLNLSSLGKDLANALEAVKAV